MKHTLKFALLLFVIFTACESHHDNSNDSDGDNKSSKIENPFIHSVYFWFKDEVTEEQLDAFYKDTENLRNIETVKGLFYGAPASTDRPIVERSYDFAVIVHFENLAGHDVYQQDQIHLNLLSKHAELWERVMVTDVDPH